MQNNEVHRVVDLCRDVAERMVAEKIQWRLDPRYILLLCDALTAALSDKQAVEVSCIACEGRPSAGNNPCAVCGRSALVDVPAVDPVAHIIEGPNGEDPRVYLTQKYDPRSPDFWLNEEARAKHRVTPLYASPPLSREGEDSAEVLKALKEAVEFANKANNYIAGQDLPASAGWLAVIAKADAALAATRSGSATGQSGTVPAGRNALSEKSE